MSRRERLFFDMDGVLACYDREAYIPGTNGVPPYMDESLHYFRGCRPDRFALELAHAAHAEGWDVYALTTVRAGIPWARNDKAWWLLKHAPWLDLATRFIVTENDKAQAAVLECRMAGLTENTILFDDFNRNLWDWRRAGGTAVKYLNGVNTPGTSGCPELSREILARAMG